MVRPQMEQVWGEDCWSEKTQEDETAHCCVTDILVHCVEKKTVHVTSVTSTYIYIYISPSRSSYLKLSKANFVIQRQYP